MPGFVLSRSRDKLALLVMHVPSYEEKGAGQTVLSQYLIKTLPLLNLGQTEFAWVFRRQGAVLRSLLSTAGEWCPSPGDELDRQQEHVVNLCEDASQEAGVAQAMPAPLWLLLCFCCTVSGIKTTAPSCPSDAISMSSDGYTL